MNARASQRGLNSGFDGFRELDGKEGMLPGRPHAEVEARTQSVACLWFFRRATSNTQRVDIIQPEPSTAQMRQTAWADASISLYIHKTY